MRDRDLTYSFCPEDCGDQVARQRTGINTRLNYRSGVASCPRQEAGRERPAVHSRGCWPAAKYESAKSLTGLLLELNKMPGPKAFHVMIHQVLQCDLCLAVGLLFSIDSEGNKTAVKAHRKPPNGAR